MTSPVEKITVRCPKCDALYETNYRGSINALLDPELAADEEYIESVTTGTCPQCEHKVRLGGLIVREEGGQEVWTWLPAEGQPFTIDNADPDALATLRDLGYDPQTWEEALRDAQNAMGFPPEVAVVFLGGGKDLVREDRDPRTGEES